MIVIIYMITWPYNQGVQSNYISAFTINNCGHKYDYLCNIDHFEANLIFIYQNQTTNA
jgi:hypothetical protein